MGFPGQLTQVFTNLLMNSSYAIEQNGRIQVKTELLNDRIQIRVEDNGKGIKPENMDKIFMPFFTTKPVGKGTGLGLSISYGIIKRHGGKIHATSQVGEGTQFTIELPLKRSVAA
jgi:signal transduction histidine kinase